MLSNGDVQREENENKTIYIYIYIYIYIHIYIYSIYSKTVYGCQYLTWWVCGIPNII